MIVHRFKALGWVAMVASAATGLYLISLQVAAERGKLEAVERQISAAERDMRQLQTELGTRASMRQLEKWNGDVLALSAPKASQFARDGATLVALNLDDAEKTPNAVPSTAMAVAMKNPSAAAIESAPQKANYVKPIESAPPKLQTIAMVQPVNARDIVKIAATETRKRP
jgi:hypothetical protein